MNKLTIISWIFVVLVCASIVFTTIALTID